MNDADVAFTSLYNTVNNQFHHADLSLSTPIHSLEPDNFTGLFDDEQGLLTIPIITTTAAATHKGGSGLGDATCIPFVQIHTTDLQQQTEPDRSYRNGFRRKTAEIKSEAELIKSELAEAAAKERVNATPTPPTTKALGSDSCSEVEAVSPLNKCPNCPFLSLCELKAQNHISTCFGANVQHRIQCPGCENVFYSVDVLSLHLRVDHQLEPQDVSTLLKFTSKPNVSAAKKVQQVQQQPKSRIYIRNVNCLREPQPEQEVNHLADFSLLPSSPDSSTNILDLLDDVDSSDVPQQQQQQQEQEPQAPPQKSAGQKISIKSVDVLREPALLPFDFQLPNVADQQLPSLMMGTNLLDVPVIGVEQEQHRQPKIYIRNVDILKEPMLLPDIGFSDATATAVANSDEVFAADTLLTPTGPAVPLPGFEPALAPLANLCPDAFSFESVLSGAGNVSSSSCNTFTALDLDFGVDFDQSVHLVTESTPPPPLQHSIISSVQLSDLRSATQDELNTQLDNYLPVVNVGTTGATTTCKQKIFIKNVDILKAPQRGTLHLRTVDELNLMNRNDMEHLIVPNREPLPMELPLNTSAAALHTPLNSLHQHSVTPETPLSYEESFDLAECWPWIEEAAIAGTQLEKETATLELPQNNEDNLIKDFPQLYTPQTLTPTSDAVPPLVPVTSSPTAASISPAGNVCGPPVPPLVPLAAEAAVPATAAEKPARIYVANNLLPATADQPQAGGTSVRGRPYGAKQAGQGKRRLALGNTQAVDGGKCIVEGCMFRFKSPTTLDYHGRCHNGSIGSAQPMICPECKSTQFSNWNCLHTHLWRTHEIDMELYCCQLCSFKTPIYSRLVNTHAKIHSDERNYKCEQCGKGFKNTKQLKNHRRLHRTQGLGMPKSTNINSEEQQHTPNSTTLHRCDDCGAAFKHRKTLREHLCKKRNEQPQCPTCQRVFSSKSSLKLHMRSHQANKRFKCDKCEYEANDHNAFRRHLATHREPKRYSCPHCDFRAIQSTAYRIHLQKRHPDQELSTIIYKCQLCSFSSINRGLLLVHQAKHDTAPAEPSKIKVKSSLLLAHSAITNGTNARDQMVESFDPPASTLNI